MTTASRPEQGEGSAEAGARYRASMAELVRSFETGRIAGAGLIQGRSQAVDQLVQTLWSEAIAHDERLGQSLTLLATGGYGRQELFPYSDVDLLFGLEGDIPERTVKDAIRSLSQQMWDAGARFAPVTRKLRECERVDPDNLEFSLAILDLRYVAGSSALSERFVTRLMPRLFGKDRKLLLRGLMALTEARHAKFGGTLFHLEPHIKDCPGGLRDVHVCRWLARLGEKGQPADAQPAAKSEFREAVDFMTGLRCFLHLLHERDNNTLDWQAQDRAAAMRVGVQAEAGAGRLPAPDAAYWMRIYFRNARSIERAVALALAAAAVKEPAGKSARRLGGRQSGTLLPRAYIAAAGRVSLAHIARAAEGPAPDTPAPGSDPEAVLGLFAAMAESGLGLDAAVEADLGAGLARLASRLEDGAALWHRLREILLGRHAGSALRIMHAVGLLDLLVPEFHGIDALVIRDAYHRYTVDEHTFVLIDTLHALGEPTGGALEPWSRRFGQVLGELPHRELLYLAALMHDTGKARSAGDHTIESARLTESVLARLELEPYEAGMVVSLVRHHLEMSAALRRDIFDAEMIQTFAGKVGTQEALRMLTLFTYADLNAVHPDALTPWKAENLWRLYIATSNHLDHSVDEVRVGALAGDLVARVSATLPGRGEAIAAYLEGFPERYVRTRSPAQIRSHFEMSEHLAQDAVQLDFRYAPSVNELVLVSLDRAALFANVAGVLAAWGMNIITADAFSNRGGVVVDSFRFTDSFRTLELNESERDRFVANVHDVLSGKLSAEKLLEGRKRGKRRGLRQPATPRFSFFDTASTHSTLLEVVTDDTPGLLRAISLTFAAHGCNIEVALVDTEGETAIDVFYLTRAGLKLDAGEKAALVAALEGALMEIAG